MSFQHKSSIAFLTKIILIIFTSFLISKISFAQSLGRIGAISDTVTTCTAGTVLMGGGSDVDAAFTWMINKSGNGDFVVIRATGTSAYNSYIYSLGPAHSVETFLINSVTLANDSNIVQTIRKAEAVFFAGGNQNDYITFYKNTALGNVLDYLANTKHAPIGGTSAGMAIQGHIYYDGITNVISPDVLLNPYLSATGIHYNDFLQNPFLKNTICETHFNTKGGTTANGITGRQGRLMSFLSRMIKDSSITDVKAIACDEKTAVCIDENGLSMVVGFGNAYFLKQWCEAPELCSSGQMLNWTNGTKVYKIAAPGSYTTPPSASKSVSLVNSTVVNGGTYEYWTVNSGVLAVGQTNGTPTSCIPAGLINETKKKLVYIFPNPSENNFTLSSDLAFEHATILILDQIGRLVFERKDFSESKINIDIAGFSAGIYVITIQESDKIMKYRFNKLLNQ
jgi:cyanophycinase